MDHGLTGRGEFPDACHRFCFTPLRDCRAELQKVFFPPTYQTVEETRPVEPGDKRLWTALRIFMELRNETTLHIPFREASKVCDVIWPNASLKVAAGLAVGWVG